MSLAHAGIGTLGKAIVIAVIAVNVAAVAFVALDPTVQVALIAGSALVLTNVPTLIVAILTRKATKEMSVNVDGNLRRLLDEKARAATEHTVTADKLAHAEGRQQGSDEERARDRDKDRDKDKS